MRVFPYPQLFAISFEKQWESDQTLTRQNTATTEYQMEFRMRILVNLTIRVLRPDHYFDERHFQFLMICLITAKKQAKMVWNSNHEASS